MVNTNTYNEFIDITSKNKVDLIAVSKTRPNEELVQLYNLGQRAFGENKVQELLKKYPELPKDIEWHLIGHLQSNKVRQIIDKVTLIHSVDSISLVREIEKQAKKQACQMNILLQIHIAEEESKFGISPNSLDEFISELSKLELKNTRVCGLMGMATFTEDQDKIKKEFTLLKSLFDNIQSQHIFGTDFRHLSMGMSDDMPIAIACGSNMVRVGSALFI